ncbi:MAG: class I SAM-dependent methyltransferase [Candidatus Falkowbacteria bacterium]
MNQQDSHLNIDKLIEDVGNSLGQEVLSQGEKGYGLFHRDRYALLAKRFLDFRSTQSQRFLEVGSYNYFVPLLAQKIGYKSFGIDLPEFIEQFKAQEIEFDLDIKPCDLSKQAIPFEDNFFDFVNFSEVLEHFNFYPVPVLKEFYRVLCPSGRLLITTPNLTRFNNRIKLLLGLSINWNIEDVFGPMTHAREYTAKEVVFLLNSAGFTKISVGYAHIDYPDINIWLRRLNRLVGRICPVLASNLIIVANK